MINTADKKSFDQRFSLIRTIDPEKMVSEEEQNSLTIRDAQQGSFFTCFGDTYYVKEKNSYQETSEDFSKPQDYTVTELTCLCLETGATGHFEWEYDDELEVSITLDQTNFKRLTDEEGQPIDEDDLDQIVSDEDSIVYAGEKFFYDDDWAAIYRRGGKEEQVFLYEFANDSASLSITIEEWTGGSKDEYRIYISKPIVPEEITIMTKGAPGNETVKTQ
ncbi:MAG: DUF4178 domain-containing protein [Desulfobacterales bacterium]|nr:DUF4178 domain-containing protein [Desulfobacterales bacterium]